MRIADRRPVAVVAVASLVAAVLAITGPASGWGRGHPPARPPDPAAAVLDPTSAVLDPAEVRLRERLGGLAALVIGADPSLLACAVPGGPVPGRAGGNAGNGRAGGDAGNGRAGQVAATIAQAEAVRELPMQSRPEIRLLTDAEMTAQVAAVFQGRWDRQRLDLEARALTALGAITPGTDLGALRVGVFARQVSGYHHAAKGVVAVRAGRPGGLSPLERTVLAHELEHALSAAYLGRPGQYREQPATADARRAASAVVEGSASVAMLQYATAALAPGEQVTLLAELRVRARQRGLAGYSPYLRAELQFPYLEGQRYTCRRWLAGGWDAVGEAYLDPPPTTAAVLFPERHQERPRDPAPLGDPGPGWQRGRATTFGAAELEWLLAAPGTDPAAALDRPRQRVAAWDGGELVVWTRGAATGVGLALVDRGAGAPALCDTVREWYAAAFPTAAASGDPDRTLFQGGRQDAVLACPGTQVRLGIGPDPAVAAAIAG